MKYDTCCQLPGYPQKHQYHIQLFIFTFTFTSEPNEMRMGRGVAGWAGWRGVKIAGGKNVRA